MDKASADKTSVHKNGTTTYGQNVVRDTVAVKTSCGNNVHWLCIFLKVQEKSQSEVHVQTERGNTFLYGKPPAYIDIGSLEIPHHV